MASTGPDLSTAVWRKSSYSNSSGGDCVEVATLWRASSYSNATGGECLEVRDDLPDAVPVRDSKAAEEGPVLLFQAPVWTAFLTSLKR
ncbi:DUF397 domain-containing protein [Streptomyces sp. NBC_01622]|uniref:DUF397 domain-containing protein n=1 Tax=Streptomyces sp. NBC_01622 TaxID=2975903 RepID=UPI0038666643|nr:DUF397 domain-containing protein [Streptomyces sp. NBC_01622]